MFHVKQTQTQISSMKANLLISLNQYGILKQRFHVKQYY